MRINHFAKFANMRRIAMINRLLMAYWRWRKQWHQREADYWLDLYAAAPELARVHEREAIRAGLRAEEIRDTPRRQRYGL
jgi:hypothetical protein